MHLLEEISEGEFSLNEEQEPIDGMDSLELNSGLRSQHVKENMAIENKYAMTKISHLDINNVKKELNSFVDVNKDFKMLNNKMLINLKPVNLGNLEVILIKNNNEISVQIKVSNPDVTSKVEDIAEEIKQSLDGKDIKVEINVKEKDGELNRDGKDEQKDKKDEEKRERKPNDENLKQFENLISEMLGEMSYGS